MALFKLGGRFCLSHFSSPLGFKKLSAPLLTYVLVANDHSLRIFCKFVYILPQKSAGILWSWSLPVRKWAILLFTYHLLTYFVYLDTRLYENFHIQKRIVSAETIHGNTVSRSPWIVRWCLFRDKVNCHLIIEKTNFITLRTMLEFFRKYRDSKM